MHKDPHIAKWHRGLAPKAPRTHPQGSPTNAPRESSDDDSSTTEHLIHQMYL